MIYPPEKQTCGVCSNGQNGFTLVELLVVIAIIGLLATIVLASLNIARQRSRDAKRLSDIREVQKAIEVNATDTNEYPRTTGGGPGGPWDDSCSDPTGWVPDVVEAKYIPVLPVDPLNSGTTCYYYRSNGTDYKIAVYMENSANQENYAAGDGGRDTAWYELFSRGGQAWQNWR